STTSASRLNDSGGGNVRPSASRDSIVSDMRDPICRASGGQAIRVPRGSARTEDEHTVGTEARRVEQRGRLRDPAAIAERLEVTDVRACVPSRASIRDEVVGAEVAEPVALRAVELEGEPEAARGVHQVFE